MTQHEAPLFKPNEEVLYLDNHSGTPSIGRVVLHKGEGLLVEQTVPDELASGKVVEQHHPAEIFSLIEAATVAGDLLPMPAEGEEVLLRDALHSVIEASPSEMKERLTDVTLEKWLSTSKTDRELGIVSKDELLGSLSQRGSNIWKINNMLEGIQNGKFAAGGYNELILASPEEDDVSLLPKHEADRVRSEIDGTNRAVLDELYDKYDVDFKNATVWEKTNSEYRTRKNIYPAGSGLFNFVETYITPAYSQVDTMSPFEVRIEFSRANDLASEGFTPAI